jgi:hypothetical protein
MFAIRHTKTGLFLYEHHEYGASLQKNGFLAFTDRVEAEDFLDIILTNYNIDNKIVLENEQEYLPEDFIVEG